MVIRIFLLLALLISGSSTVLAQSKSDEEAACRGDVRRFCHNKERGEIAGCLLSQRREKLSSRCRALLKSKGV